MTSSQISPQPAWRAPPVSPGVLKSLEAADIPLTSICEACDGCSEEDHDEGSGYPKGFEVDMEENMMGMKAYGRRVLVSTGKSDWPREVTEVKSSLAYNLENAYTRHLKELESASSSSDVSRATKLLSKLGLKGKAKNGGSEGAQNDVRLPEGIYTAPAVVRPKSIGEGRSDENSTSDPPFAEPRLFDSTRLSILASSVVSSSSHPNRNSVIVFPDYKIVTEVENSEESANEVVDRYLSPQVGRTGNVLDNGKGKEIQSWPLPYRAVILICSHKTRDKRCHIAAPLLIESFTEACESKGWSIDQRGDIFEHLHSQNPTYPETSIESWAPDGVETTFDRVLRSVAGAQDAEGPDTHGEEDTTIGIFKVSHVGGHKFSGNVIVHFPNGSSIFYGRVTPRDVEAIVERTLVKGQVIQEFLRGGIGIAGRRGCAKGVLAW